MAINAPQAAGIGVGGDNLTRLAWRNPDNSSSLWTLNADGSVATQTPYAAAVPSPNFVGLAVGANNVPRLLWNLYTPGTNHYSQTYLWNMTDPNPAATSLVFGPYSGWNAQSFAIGSDSAPRMLWNNDSGQIALWHMNPTGASFTQNDYGPYPGWEAQAVAVGPDNVPRIMWNHPVDAEMSLWRVAPDGTFTQNSYGPYTGWGATIEAVDSTNAPRILWSSGSTASLWKVAADGSFAFQNYTYPAGYTPVGMACGTGGDVRLLWNDTHGDAQVWTIAADGTYTVKTYTALLLTSVTLNPATVTGGSSSTATVTLNSPAPAGGVTVGLSVFSPVGSSAAATVPVNVLVAAGATSATFPIATTAVTTSANDYITVGYLGMGKGAFLTINPASSFSLDLAAAATGANKITLYWSGYSGASGYNVYRGLQSGGPYTRVNSSGPVNTPDNSAGLTNVFMYTDSPLATGTTYYYYVAPVVQNGTEAGQSNEDSATPNANAVPWDTADPTQIINAVSATAALDLEPDYDDSGDAYPAQVGVLQVAGPDGAVYMGNFPNGSPAQAFTSHAYSDGNSIYYDDGRVIASPNYDQTNAGTTNSVMSANLSPHSTPVPDKTSFPATSIPSGIYREVNSVPGYTGFSAIVGIPNANDPQTVNIANNIDTVTGKSYPDAIDIYSGGYVYTGGTVSVGASGPLPLDAGLQLTLLPKTASGTYPIGFWEPVINGKRSPPIDPNTKMPNTNALLPSVFLDGSTKVLPTGTLEYKEKLSGEVKMQFLTPAAPNVVGQSVELHFSLPLTGVGTGQISLISINPKTQQTSVSNVNEVTLVYYHVPGWQKSSKFVIKRINSIAQTLRSRTPSAYESTSFDPSHPGAPYANSPTNQTTMGYLNDGSYVVAPVGSGSFSGAYWGEGDTSGVELRGANGGWISWTDDPTITNAAGAYPNPLAYSKAVNWLEQNPYFWEENVNLTAL